jgi:hypothetical protein
MSNLILARNFTPVLFENVLIILALCSFVQIKASLPPANKK